MLWISNFKSNITLDFKEHSNLALDSKQNSNIVLGHVADKIGTSGDIIIMMLGGRILGVTGLTEKSINKPMFHSQTISSRVEQNHEGLRGFEVRNKISKVWGEFWKKKQEKWWRKEEDTGLAGVFGSLSKFMPNNQNNREVNPISCYIPIEGEERNLQV